MAYFPLKGNVKASDSFQDLQAKADRLNDHLDYLNEKMVILMGILSTLITNMVWIIPG